MLKPLNIAASAFEWEFQSSAAIMLLLKNMENASKVKVDGANENVEITFSNGKILAAQVEEVANPDDSSFVIDKLEKALKALNSASEISNVDQLVYVTNSPNPFNNRATMCKFKNPLNMVPFSDLPPDCQKTIQDICSKNGYSIDASILTICVMQFHGKAEDERYKTLQSLTMDFFNDLGIDRVSVNQMLSLWKNAFKVNASRRTAVITKESIIWPVIDMQSKICEADTELEDYTSDIADILEEYQAVIDANSKRFEFAAKVLRDFNDFCPAMQSKERTERFISEKWKRYKSDFALQEEDSFEEEMVIRLTILAVLKRHRISSMVKNKVKL